MDDRGSVFAPPSAPPPRADLAAVGRFLLQRALRVGVTAAGVGLVSASIGHSWAWFTIGAGLAALVLLPTSLILARITLFPGEPDSRFVSTTGTPVHLTDVRWTARAQVTEYLLGALWLPLLGVSALGLEGAVRYSVLVVLALVGVLQIRRGTNAVITLALHEATIDLAVGNPRRALRLTSLLERLPGRAGDGVLSVLSMARLRTGDVPGAISALDRIRHRQRYRVGPLRAQLTIARDSLDDAAAMGRSLATDDPESAAILATLVDLYSGRADAVADRADTLMSHPDPQARRSLALLIGASLAHRDPVRAAGLLTDHEWRPDDLSWIAPLWPPVAEALEQLPGW